ncbi:hypothetical protein BHE74_00000508 [Ensete ventricosum]|nr:hypothetical protein BHE74_00000508 [Ensete ventricosum]
MRLDKSRVRENAIVRAVAGSPMGTRNWLLTKGPTPLAGEIGRDEERPLVRVRISGVSEERRRAKKRRCKWAGPWTQPISIKKKMGRSNRSGSNDARVEPVTSTPHTSAIPCSAFASPLSAPLSPLLRWNDLEMAAALARLSRRTLAVRSRLIPLHRLLSAEATAAEAAAVAPPPQTASDRVKWDYRGQRQIIPLGQWVPTIAVDAYVAPNVVLAGQVTVCDGASVWNGAVLRGDLNKITVGFCSNVQERCVLHAAWKSPTGPLIPPI